MLKGLVWDPRSGTDPIATFAMHTGMGREARCIFAGGRLVSTGFTNVSFLRKVNRSIMKNLKNTISESSKFSCRSACRKFVYGTAAAGPRPSAPKRYGSEEGTVALGYGSSWGAVTHRGVR